MLSNLAAKYWFVCGIAVIIALIVYGRSAAEREWLGLVAGIVAGWFEVRSIRRSLLNNQRQ
jgi:hypothetical protein